MSEHINLLKRRINTCREAFDNTIPRLNAALAKSKDLLKYTPELMEVILDRQIITMELALLSKIMWSVTQEKKYLEQLDNLQSSADETLEILIESIQFSSATE